MKKCSKCKLIKGFDSFYKQKDKKDGLRSHCKDCIRYDKLRKNRTLLGKIKTIYNGQVSNSIAKGNEPPKYTKEEFIKYCFYNTKFRRLHAKWVISGYRKELAPSIDRVDDYKGYTFENIQIMTWGENKAKSHLDMKCGKNNKNSKAILQLNLKGVLIKEFYSQSQAARELNLNASNINSALRGKQSTSGGFKFKYKKNE